MSKTVRLAHPEIFLKDPMKGIVDELWQEVLASSPGILQREPEDAKEEVATVNAVKLVRLLMAVTPMEKEGPPPAGGPPPRGGSPKMTQRPLEGKVFRFQRRGKN